MIGKPEKIIKQINKKWKMISILLAKTHENMDEIIKS